MAAFTHVPVLCEEVLSLLAPAVSRPGAHLVDATIGLAGHAAAALERFPDLTLTGIDRDPEAIGLAGERLAPYAGRWNLVQATYDTLPAILGRGTVDGILFDLGLSSLQIDNPAGGFAYAADTPLTMRMDRDVHGVTAADVVNTYSATELAHLFRVYGDEPHAGRIATAIVEHRRTHPFATTAELAEVVAAAIPSGTTRRGHPAKRVFQAVRMEVNDERALLARALPAALAALNLGGRLVVLSYHSGEDRLVKRQFAAASTDDVPRGLPEVPATSAARFTVVTRGAVAASDAEVADNPRARPARLRAIERIREDRS